MIGICIGLGIGIASVSVSVFHRYGYLHRYLIHWYLLGIGSGIEDYIVVAGLKANPE